MPPAPKGRKIELDDNGRGRVIRRRVYDTGDTLQRSDKCGCTPQGYLRSATKTEGGVTNKVSSLHDSSGRTLWEDQDGNRTHDSRDPVGRVTRIAGPSGH